MWRSDLLPQITSPTHIKGLSPKTQLIQWEEIIHRSKHRTIHRQTESDRRMTETDVDRWIDKKTTNEKQEVRGGCVLPFCNWLRDRGCLEDWSAPQLQTSDSTCEWFIAGTQGAEECFSETHSASAQHLGSSMGSLTKMYQMDLHIKHWSSAVYNNTSALCQRAKRVSRPGAFCSHLCLCRRGRQTSPTCNGPGGWEQLRAGRASSGWQTARQCRWGSWVWWRRCAAPRRTRSACSWTFGRRSRRWHKLPGRTESRLEMERERERQRRERKHGFRSGTGTFQLTENNSHKKAQFYWKSQICSSWKREKLWHSSSNVVHKDAVQCQCQGLQRDELNACMRTLILLWDWNKLLRSFCSCSGPDVHSTRTCPWFGT